MGGRASRDKGGRGEREAIALLQPIVDRVCEQLGQPQFVLERNAKQRYSKKQYDIIGIPWIALEIKRVENQGAIGSWWKQVKNATLDKQISVLMYRPNHAKWKVRMRVPIMAGTVRVTATINVDIETFLFWFYHFMYEKLK